MRRQTRNGFVAVGLVAAVALFAAGWFVTRGPGAGAAVAATSTPSGSQPTAQESTPTPQATLPSPPSASARATATSRKPHAVSTPKPVPSTVHRPFSFPVPVVVGNAQQVITVKARGSYATVIAWQYRGGAWHQVLSTPAARVGTNGVVPGSTRKQGTDTSPAGTYTMTEAFGIASNPGTALPYHQVTSDDWWVEDNHSAYYNEMRGASQGGFSVTTAGVNGSEHLSSSTTQYRYVVVINFNRPPNAVRYRGAGIFLHVNGTGSTAGCVSVPLSTMVSIIDWLQPGMHPRIAIA